MVTKVAADLLVPVVAYSPVTASTEAQILGVELYIVEGALRFPYVRQYLRGFTYGLLYLSFRRCLVHHCCGGGCVLDLGKTDKGIVRNEENSHYSDRE